MIYQIHLSKTGTDHIHLSTTETDHIYLSTTGTDYIHLSTSGTDMLHVFVSTEKKKILDIQRMKIYLLLTVFCILWEIVYRTCSTIDRKWTLISFRSVVTKT